MKKFTTMAYVAALALVSTAGLTSCKSDEPGNDYNGETVKTEIAISLPSQATKGAGINRMPSTTVQDAGLDEFQGLENIMLVPFNKQVAITASDNRLGNNINLSPAIDKSDIENIKSKAVCYSNVKIPLTTSSFLFYATSAATGTKFEVGSMIVDTANTHATPADFTFDLEPIVPTANIGNLTGTGTVGGTLLEYLTHVAIASDGADTPKRWYDYTAGDDAGMKALFDSLTSMEGLSTFEVERILSDIYKSLTPVNSPIANAVKDSINNTKYIASITSGNVTLKSSLQGYPETLHKLPQGSISIKWDGSAHIFTVGEYTGMAKPDTYTYPANLWYFVNSTIVTSNASRQTMYDNTNYWAAVIAAHTDGPAVTSRTRAVAIKDTVQYAVARLDVQARLSATTLADNSYSVEGVATNVNVTAGFPITAILVGGQKQVGFDFTPTAGEHTEMTIYDNVMASTQKATPATMMAMPGESYSAMNHTLVLENGTNDVMIAVEMVNTTGKDFYGIGGRLIPKDSKFYVVGKLTAASATETGGKVFKQDYTTTAKLTLTNLKTAYNTLPDLRTPQLELGFAVDLSWKSGHTYEINFN